MQPFQIDEFIKLFLKTCLSSHLDRILKNNSPSRFKRDVGLKLLMLLESGLPDFGINLSSNSSLNRYNTNLKTRLKQAKQIITNTEIQFIYFVRNHVYSRSSTILSRVEYFFKFTERDFLMQNIQVVKKDNIQGRQRNTIVMSAKKYTPLLSA